MPFYKFEAFVRQYRRLFVVLITAVIVQLFELILLHYKYDIFTGGFLQPFGYRTIPERMLFIVVSFWFDLFVTGMAAALWFYVSDKCIKRYGLIVYYDFMVVVLLANGIWLEFKFKVLSYFSDAINLQIISNLGAGSLKGALIYVSNEIGLFIAIIGIVSVGSFVIVRLLQHNAFVCRVFENDVDHGSYGRLLIIAAGMTVVLNWIGANNDFLRYGLWKKTSYRLVSGMLDKLSDVDFDGYGVFSYPKDKAPLVAAIYPGALDIPGNGKDEDGFLGDAVVPEPVPDNFAGIMPKAGKHIFLIVLESARADLLDQQINGHYVAPVMREIVKTGAAIQHAYSHTGYTITSLKALFNRDLAEDKQKLTLIKFLQAAGYQVSILSGQDESFGDVAEATGMANPENYYFDARTAIDDRVFPNTDSGSLRLSEERIIQQFQERFKQTDFTRSQFFYINFQAAHFPYSHPKMARRIIKDFIPRSEIKLENKEWVAASYWNAIANADWAVGKVIEALSEKKLLEQSTIVILGDHGESLFDDRFLGHGHAINDTQTLIPLIINDPNVVVAEPMGQVDVAELTVRSALGLKNNWSNQDKKVFQFVGTLAQPALIAQVSKNGVRTLFDFQSEAVFFSELKQWKPYQEAMADPNFKNRTESLIREWEALRWQNYNGTK